MLVMPTRLTQGIPRASMPEHCLRFLSASSCMSSMSFNCSIFLSSFSFYSIFFFLRISSKGFENLGGGSSLGAMFFP